MQQTRPSHGSGDHAGNPPPAPLDAIILWDGTEGRTDLTRIDAVRRGNGEPEKKGLGRTRDDKPYCSETTRAYAQGDRIVPRAETVSALIHSPDDGCDSSGERP